MARPTTVSQQRRFFGLHFALACAVSVGGCFDAETAEQSTVTTDSSATSTATTSTTSTDVGSSTQETVTGTIVDTTVDSSSSTTETDTSTSDSSTDDACGPGADCIEAAPPGWLGPFARTFGTPAVQPAVCAGVAPLELPLSKNRVVYGQIADVPVGCSGCDGCAGQVSVSEHACDAQLDYAVFDATRICSGDDVGSLKYEFGLQSDCVAPTLKDSIFTSSRTWSNRLQWTQGKNVQPSCGVAPEVKEVRGDPWGQQIRGCQPTQLAVCGATGMCVGELADSFSAGWCVARSGVTTCPSGMYAHAETFYGSVVDARSCSACTCAGQGELACQFEITTYSEKDCQGNSQVPESGDCYAYDELPDVSARATARVPGVEAYCKAGGGEAMGHVVESDPLTVCCSAPW